MLPGRLQAPHLGHVDVHQHEVRVQRVGKRDRLETVGGLADQFEALGAAQDSARGQAEWRLVVDDDD